MDHSDDEDEQSDYEYEESDDEYDDESDLRIDTHADEDDNSSAIISKQIPKSRLDWLLPRVGIRRCAGCTLAEVSASVWCCECSRCLCSACDTRMHDTDALDSLQRPLCSHRVEYISGGGGLPILSPILEWIVLATMIWAIRPAWTHLGTLLHVDYFFESVCPIVQQIRRWVFQIDHALYPLLRGPLADWCDTEDAFLKIFSDLWVRGILTHTDSFALLLMKIPTTIGALLIYLTVLPLFAIPYAIVATLVRWIEITLIPNWMVTRFVGTIVRIIGFWIWLPFRLAGWFCRSTALGLVMDSDFREYFHRRIKIPPKTGHRKRPIPSHGWRDIQFFGSFSRIKRIFAYFHRKARRAIIATIITVVFWTLALRILLLCLPRCGNGLLSHYAEGQMMQFLEIPEDEVPPGVAPESVDLEDDRHCLSIDMLARRLSHRIEVEIPEFSSLGEEGRVLARMQQATENDYLDDTLQHIVHSLYLRFLKIPFKIRMILRLIVYTGVFSGLARRILFWIDLKHRNRFHQIRMESQNLQNQPTT